MPRFVFELDAVLTQRESEELRAQVRLATVEAERSALERRIRMAHEWGEQERAALKEFLGSNARTIDVLAARRQATAIHRASMDARRAVLQLAGVHKRLEAARAELIECTTRRKAVETLRERRYQAFLSEEKRREASALDEMNITRGARAIEGHEVAT